MNSHEAADRFRTQNNTPAGEVPLATLARGLVGSDNLRLPSIPQHLIETDGYQITGTDDGKDIVAGSDGLLTILIPDNDEEALPIGFVCGLLNMYNNTISIEVTNDTLTLIPDGTTGSRDLAQYGQAFLKKITATSWVISGNSALT